MDREEEKSHKARDEGIKGGGGARVVEGARVQADRREGDRESQQVDTEAAQKTPGDTFWFEYVWYGTKVEEIR
jgi:hypothetical protein